MRGEKIVKLKNGGTLIYNHSRLNNCSAFELGFSVGTFNEKKTGTAHFLEHMLFKKTKNRTGAELDADRTKIAFLNASTSMDYLVIRLFRSNKLIDKSLEFASDVLLNSVVDDDFFNSEKGVISEELIMCLDEESRDIYVKNFRQAQSKARFASDIIGKNLENIGRIKFKDLINFKDKFFIGNNFICSAVSSLPIRRVKKLINEHFSEKLVYQVDYKKNKSYFEAVKIDKPTSLRIIKNNQDKITMLISFKIGKDELEIFQKNFNFAFLSKYFTGVSGELFTKLRNRGLIYRLDSDYSCYKTDSMFHIVFETTKEKIKEICEVIAEQIKKLVETGVEEEYIEAYKKNFDYISDEKMPVKMSILCHSNLMDYLSFGKLFRLTDKQKRKLKEEVSSEGVKKVANEIFKKNNDIYITVLGNATKKYIPNIEWFEKKFLVGEI